MARTEATVTPIISEPESVYHSKAKQNLSSHQLADFRKCPELYHKKQLGLIPAGRRDLDDVWEFPRPKRSEEHPTMKPVDLVARALVNSSSPGDLVLEPFSGSGSTLIACEKTGRRCRAVELAPAYVDVAVKRWEEFSGKSAERGS